MGATNLLALTLLLQNLCADQPTNTLPPTVIPILTYTNTLVSTDWVQTSDFKIEAGVRLGKSIMYSVGTNTEREVVTAVISFRTNPVPLTATRVMLAGDTNAPVKWGPNLPPVPGMASRE
jgi:hypothetical protein